MSDSIGTKTKTETEPERSITGGAHTHEEVEPRDDPMPEPDPVLTPGDAASTLSSKRNEIVRPIAMPVAHPTQTI